MTVATSEVHRLKRKTAYIVFGVLGVLLIISNIGAERETRRMEPMQKTISEQLPGNEYEAPVEAGEAVDEFLKGFEKATKSSR